MRSHSKLPLVGLTLLASAVLVSCGGEASKDLQTLKGDGFTVSMPGNPKRTEKSVATTRGAVKTVTYTSDSSDKAFSISYTELLPKGVKGDALHAAIAGGAADVHGTVNDEKATTYQGFTARDARITGAAHNKGTVFVRTILAKGRLYVLQSIGEGKDRAEAPDAYDKIVNSLKIE